MKSYDVVDFGAPLRPTEKPTPNRFQLLSELAILAGGRGDAAEIADLLDNLGKLPSKEALRWQMAALNGMAEGMGRRVAGEVG